MSEVIKEFKDEFRFLSNFWSSPIEHEGKVYPTAEHLYQAMKASTDEGRELVRCSEHAGIAKKLGKTVVLVAGWEGAKDDVMRMVVRKKFTQNKNLAKKLLATGDKELQEGNWWGDEYFGVSLKNGQGLNKLGIILQEVRENIREEQWMKKSI